MFKYIIHDSTTTSSILFFTQFNMLSDLRVSAIGIIWFMTLYLCGRYIWTVLPLNRNLQTLTFLVWCCGTKQSIAKIIKKKKLVEKERRTEIYIETCRRLTFQWKRDAVNHIWMKRFYAILNNVCCCHLCRYSPPPNFIRFLFLYFFCVEEWQFGDNFMTRLQKPVFSYHKFINIILLKRIHCTVWYNNQWHSKPHLIFD